MSEESNTDPGVKETTANMMQLGDRVAIKILFETELKDEQLWALFMFKSLRAIAAAERDIVALTPEQFKEEVRLMVEEVDANKPAPKIITPPKDIAAPPKGVRIIHTNNN